MKTDLRNKLAQVGTLIATRSEQFGLDAAEDEIHITYDEWVSDELGQRRVKTTLVVSDVIEEWD